MTTLLSWRVGFLLEAVIIALGGLLIALPLYLQIDLGYNALQAGLSLAPLSLTMFVIALLAGRRAGKRRPSAPIRAGFVLLNLGVLVMVPIVPRADTSLYLAVPPMLCGAGLGLLVSQINNYTLAPISEERAQEEILRINDEARPQALQVALLVPLLVSLLGLALSFRMLRLPDPAPSKAAELAALG